jgi:VWFA-related protein
MKSRLLAGAALLPVCAWAQPQPVFRSDVEAVYVDVFVTKGGQPVPGLKAADFELKDNGVRQGIELLQADSQPVNAVLVFDTSSSMAGERLSALRSAGRAFLDGLRPADQAALVTFGEEVGWRLGPTGEKDRVRRALDATIAYGATAAFDALYAAIALSEPQGRSLVLLFSDGEDNTSILDAVQLKKVAERSNALVHFVSGWRRPAWRPPGTTRIEAAEPDDVKALREIAEASGGRLWSADSGERLRSTFAAIAEAMRHRYVLRYEATGVKREGWHKLEVRLRGPKGDVETRRGYWVGR